METTLLDLDCLSLFFNNYKQEDIQYLSESEEFRHFWNFKRAELSPDNEIAWWLGFSRYLSHETKCAVLELARACYLEEAKRRHANDSDSLKMDDWLRRIEP
ncbi:hypothetical protein [Persicitalea jodogahamensis]|uniref:Uncharacterized protein n=1 Tax=Persicitalea jodogahamensis TaxID=402147 RepID=A0A8J3D8C9_9BACT|nr:hypothetical protein [Persicitalea jodogahamensis]GHB87511.1 hypothetical protein GCM10007390_49270 [Persicitalea jodogahamensis]